MTQLSLGEVNDWRSGYRRGTVTARVEAAALPVFFPTAGICFQL